MVSATTKPATNNAPNKYHSVHIPKLTKAYSTNLHTMLHTNKRLHSKIKIKELKTHTLVD